MVEAVADKHPFLLDFEKFERNLTLGGPVGLSEARREAIARFAGIGFPTQRDEDWKYTNLKPLEATRFALAARGRTGGLGDDAVSRMTFEPPESARLVFVNGHFSPELSDLGRLPAGVRVDSLGASLASDPAIAAHLTRIAAQENRPFVALNTAFLADGAFVFVPRGVVLSHPIHLVFFGTEEDGRAIVSHPRSLVVAEESAQLRLVESHAGRDGEIYFTNAVTEMVLGENAIVERTKVNRDSRSAFHVSSLDVHQARSSTLLDVSVSFGGRLVRNEIRVLLGGEGCDATIDGLTLISGNQHVDTQTLVDHAHPHCTSHELYKGILDDEATSAFNGKILVREKAQKTDAKQTNMNLLLSDSALANTKPQLEIYADDVKCTHGATIGQLDHEALFYLRSRGISESAAKSLLTYAFANDVIQRIKNEPVRERLDAFLFERLPEGSVRR